MVIPAALVFGIGWPWLEHVGNLEREIESLDDQTTRYRRLLLTLPGLQAELDQVRSNEDVKDFYFDAKTPALAGAQLQREVQEMVKASGGRVVSTQVLASAEDEQPPKVRVRAQIQGKTEALLEVLYQLEQARPFLFVDQMSIRSAARGRWRNATPSAWAPAASLCAPPAPGAAHGAPGRLRLRARRCAVRAALCRARPRPGSRARLAVAGLATTAAAGERGRGEGLRGRDTGQTEENPLDLLTPLGEKEEYADVTERPLFLPDRRPPSEEPRRKSPRSRSRSAISLAWTSMPS